MSPKLDKIYHQYVRFSAHQRITMNDDILLDCVVHISRHVRQDHDDEVRPASVPALLEALASDVAKLLRICPLSARTRKRVHIQSQGTHLGDPSRRVLVADNRIRLSNLHACPAASTL